MSERVVVCFKGEKFQGTGEGPEGEAEFSRGCPRRPH